MKKLFIVFILITVGLLVWWNISLSPVNPTDKHSEIFVVEKGAGIKSIARRLYEKNLIRNQTFFYLLIKQMGIENKIKAGSFRLSPSLSSRQIATSLTKSSLDIWVTIPEGKRAEEIGDILETSLPSYKGAWRQQLDANEGYLFPDTYLFPAQSSIEQIITTMRNNFDKKYEQVNADKTVDLTQEQIVIVASIVEREAVSSADMDIVASVLENRLSLGMALGSDVTVEYALGYQPAIKTWWKKDLSVNDLQIHNPYNTRLNSGLPPTPISNPGLVALKAAANPPSSDYLYFIADKKGVVHFAKTLQGHNANIQKYGL